MKLNRLLREDRQGRFTSDRRSMIEMTPEKIRHGLGISEDASIMIEKTDGYTRMIITIDCFKPEEA